MKEDLLMKATYLSNIENLPNDLGTVLQQRIPGLVKGKTLFIDTLGETESDCCAIFEAPGAVFNPLAGINRRKIIVQARSLTSAIARSKIWQVFRCFADTQDNLLELTNGKHPYTFGDTPHKVGKDEKGRITFQFTMYILYHD